MLNFRLCNRPPKVCIDSFQLQHFNTEARVSGRGSMPIPSSCFWVPTCYVTTAMLNYSRHSGEPAESLKEAPIQITNKPWMSSLVSFSSPF